MAIESILYTVREYTIDAEAVANAIKEYLENNKDIIFSDDYNIKVLDNGSAIVQIRHPNITRE